MKTPILILAAGNSSRLGAPKQLLPYKGGNLLAYTIQECIASQLGTVYVVIGAYHNEIAASIQHLNCQICYTPNWSEGLSSSIAFGVQQLPNRVDGCFIVLGDQPHFTKLILEKIKNTLSGNDTRIVLSKYRVGKGPPSYFDISLFEELKALRGDDGAKAIVRKHKEKIRFVDFPLGHLDVDVPEDKARLG